MLNERGKFGAKIFAHQTDIGIFVLEYFNLNHPVFMGTHLRSHLAKYSVYICVGLSYSYLLRTKLEACIAEQQCYCIVGPTVLSDMMSLWLLRIASLPAQPAPLKLRHYGALQMYYYYYYR